MHRQGYPLKNPSFSRRSRIDIIACILKNSIDGSRKTRLISRSNLNVPQFNLYENLLVEAGLLSILTLEDQTETFETTEKGKEFLRDYAEIKGILEKMHSNNQKRR